MKQQNYPAGWNEERVRKLLLHYQTQTEAEAVAEDEAAFRRRDQDGREENSESRPLERRQPRPPLCGESSRSAPGGFRHRGARRDRDSVRAEKREDLHDGGLIGAARSRRHRR